MNWNFMRVELRPEDQLATPIIGPGNLSRQKAHAEIQSLLDQAPELATIAQTWRVGAKDDTVYSGVFIWTIYEHPAGEDPRKAAIAWLDDLADTMRKAGIEVGIAKLDKENHHDQA